MPWKILLSDTVTIIGYTNTIPYNPPVPSRRKVCFVNTAAKRKCPFVSLLKTKLMQSFLPKPTVGPEESTDTLGSYQSHPNADSSHCSLTIFVSRSSTHQAPHSPGGDTFDAPGTINSVLQSTATLHRGIVTSSSKHLRGASPKTNPATAPQAPNTSSKKRATPACCTTPIPAIFAAACLVIAGAFAATTATPVSLFYSQLTSLIEHSFAQGLEASMKYITDPLDQTVIFVAPMVTLLTLGISPWLTPTSRSSSWSLTWTRICS